MLSRIFWVGIAGIALITGMVIQDGNRIFSWTSDHTDISARTERAIESSIERAVDGNVDRMQVVDANGREMDVPPELRRAMGEAVGELLKAEADLAVLRIRDGTGEERQAAETRRAEARAEVDRLKAVIRNEQQAARTEQEAIRDQVRDQIREDVRDSVREAVGN